MNQSFGGSHLHTKRKSKRPGVSFSYEDLQFHHKDYIARRDLAIAKLYELVKN